MKKNTAFTLSEVLITLGIIGIVAAITMPSLIANYQKKVWVNQLKKSVSTFEQGFQKMLADNEVDNLADTNIFRLIDGTCSNSSDTEKCSNFYNELNKYIKIVSIGGRGDYQHRFIAKGSSWRSDTQKIITLADGSLLQDHSFIANGETSSYTCSQITEAGGKMCTRMGNICIDVNGKKKPNVVGRDLFCFDISEKGMLIPWWGYDYALYRSPAYGLNTKYWKNVPTACGHPGIADAEKISPYGTGCSARVIENGWIMDY